VCERLADVVYAAKGLKRLASIADPDTEETR
jgi:hypothetical protein